MSNLSEEEILDKLRKMLYHTQKANECGLSNNDFKEDIEALEGILDLYNKEIEKNKELKKQMGKDLDVVYLQGVYNERDKWKSKVSKYLNKMEKRCDKPKFSVMKKEIEQLLQEGDK